MQAKDEEKQTIIARSQRLNIQFPKLAHHNKKNSKAVVLNPGCKNSLAVGEVSVKIKWAAGDFYNVMVVRKIINSKNILCTLTTLVIDRYQSPNNPKISKYLRQHQGFF